MSDGDPAQAPVVQRLVALPTDELFELYFELCGADPDRADVAALAIREQARAGRLPDGLAEVLGACVESAPNLLCIGHLAKALGALGRAAQSAAGSLVEALTSATIVDDTDYWSFDGCIWALGYLGGPDAAGLLADLDGEKPSRAVRSQSIYRGAMLPADRDRLFRRALDAARALVASKDPGRWTARKGQIRSAAPAKAVPAKQKAWMVR